jgi:hypothetical protein
MKRILLFTGGALEAFHIDTWGVTPLAVCKVLPLWDIRAEKFMDPAASYQVGQTPTTGR